LNFHNFEASKQRIQQFEREADNNRLAREARSGSQSTNSVINSVLAALGEHLVELGSRLQGNEHDARLPEFETR